jgi:hypothetical protein
MPWDNRVRQLILIRVNKADWSTLAIAIDSFSKECGTSQQTLVHELKLLYGEGFLSLRTKCNGGVIPYSAGSLSDKEFFSGPFHASLTFEGKLYLALTSIPAHGKARAAAAGPFNGPA